MSGNRSKRSRNVEMRESRHSRQRTRQGHVQHLHAPPEEEAAELNPWNARGNEGDIAAMEVAEMRKKLQEARESSNRERIAFAEIDVAQAKLKAANTAGNERDIAAAEVEVAKAELRGEVEVAKAKLEAAKKAGNERDIAAAEVEVAEAKLRGEVEVAKAKLGAAKKAGNDRDIAAAEVEVAKAELRGEVEVAKAKLVDAQTKNQTQLVDDLQRSLYLNQCKLADFDASLPMRLDTEGNLYLLRLCAVVLRVVVV